MKLEKRRKRDMAESKLFVRSTQGTFAHHSLTDHIILEDSDMTHPLILDLNQDELEANQ